MPLLRRSALVAAVCGFPTMLAAAPAGAADNINRETLSFPAGEQIVATCADGSDVGLGFDLVRNVHLRHDRNGDVVSDTRNVNYTGTFEHLNSGEEYTFHGTRIVTFDFVEGTFTSRGNYRTVTMPREGTVLHESGIYVEDLDVAGLFYHRGGPTLDEFAAGSDAVCGLFGIEGA